MAVQVVVPIHKFKRTGPCILQYSKALFGYAVQYFNVQNSVSEKALSLFTRSRLYEGEKPSSSS